MQCYFITQAVDILYGMRCDRGLADYGTEGMLQEARRHRNHGNVVFILSDDLAEFDLVSFDAVISLITLQHIRPALMKEYIGGLLRLLKPGCYAFLHIPTEIAFQTGRTQYEIEEHYLPREELEIILSANNCVVRDAVSKGIGSRQTAFIFVLCKNRT